VDQRWITTGISGSLKHTHAKIQLIQGLPGS
jgi:hypothetical protein